MRLKNAIKKRWIKTAIKKFITFARNIIFWYGLYSVYSLILICVMIAYFKYP